MLSVILHNIRSLHNVGSMFRTSDAAGVEKVYLCGYTPKPVDLMGRVRPEIAKVALGAEQSVPWEYHRQTLRLMQRLQKEGVQVIALEQTQRSIDYRDFNPVIARKTHQRPTKQSRDRRALRARDDTSLVLIVGNEVDGIPKRLTDAADAVIQIPMYGSKESLNVSVAFGIAIYQFLENSPRAKSRGYHQR